jgi:hypothetical protein
MWHDKADNKCLKKQAQMYEVRANSSHHPMFSASTQAATVEVSIKANFQYFGREISQFNVHFNNHTMQLDTQPFQS